MGDMRINRIAKLVVDHHLSFLGEMFGPDWISSEDYSRLNKSGMIRGEYVHEEFMKVAHRIGGVPMFSMKPTLAKSGAFTIGHVLDSIIKGKPLSAAEEEAIHIAKSRVAQRVAGLSKRMAKAVRAELARTLMEKGSAMETAAIIAKMTGDSNRDWLRVVVTELHTAVQEGKAASLVKKFGGDPLVYKRPRADACPFCKALYLKKDGVTPRVFRYSELVEKGSNESRKPNPGITRGVRKSDDWQPVIGSVHPWCQCELYHLPDGFTFDGSGGLAPGGRIAKSESVPDLIYHECVQP